MRCYNAIVKLLLHLAENDEKTNKQYKEELETNEKIIETVISRIGRCYDMQYDAERFCGR